ncbi:MFS transporter [Pullulanibacillus sp. KACC 23026]|uniref:MDR family MFS transporter n=1 Tax=Pullulanibacillus sp. KACC 23026 TaxID=3028315 RepID=UPI0023AF5F2F|nr:MFS transporter [Pullulanibacillus sp. KACC 23026]WEG13745.1 MFS transporter [Pullulanibacillus sp. KACC 23026]
MKWRDWDINLKVRLLGEGANNLLFWMFFPFMAIYFSQSFGKEMAGLLLVATQFISVVLGLVGGYCADHFGRKRMMVLSTLGQGITFIFFALANSPWYSSPVLTFISFTVLGLCGNFYWPASHAMVADVVDAKHRNHIFAVFYTSINISVVLGPIIGGFLFFSARFALLAACVLTSFAVAAVLQLFVHETAPVRKKVVAEETAKWTRYVLNQLSDYKVIAKDRLFLLFILAGVLVAQTFMQLDLLIAVYANDKVPTQTIIHLGNWSLQAGGSKIFSWLVSENGFLVALLTVLMTKWMGRYKERSVFIGSCLFYGVSMLVMSVSVNIWILFLSIVLFTSAELMVVGIQEGFVSKLAPENMRGQYFAASSLRFTIGRMIAPMSIPLTVWMGYSWTFVILALLAFLGAGFYAAMFYQKEKLEVQEEIQIKSVLD